MAKNDRNSKDILKRRELGTHITSKDIFLKYIFPEIKEKLYNFIWVDLYAGKGNLILPILNYIPPEKRINFFEKHIYLFDIQEEMVKQCIKNTVSYGIPIEVSKKNINQRNNLSNFPNFLLKKVLPIFHITNPPYLYLGYIRKKKSMEEYLPLFEKENKGYQDLYQIAMMNDLKNGIKNLIYIIPSNFLFGASVSNKFRLDFLSYYNILKMIIFETKIFDYTGTNICIGFFKRKLNPGAKIQKFNGIKIKKNDKILRKNYNLKPRFKYRAGSEFDEFLESYRAKSPLKIKYYLLRDQVLKNKGSNTIKAIDANNYKNNKYKLIELKLNDNLMHKIKSNILYIKTVDSGSMDGRVGIGLIKDEFHVDAIYVSSNTYRTHPIQIFLEPGISIDDQKLLKNYFNFMLEYFREQLDSEFLTTYKYSNAEYTRKYLGLSQVRKLIQTFPILNLNLDKKKELELAIKNQNFEKILDIFNSFNELD